MHSSDKCRALRSSIELTKRKHSLKVAVCALALALVAFLAGAGAQAAEEYTIEVNGRLLPAEDRLEYRDLTLFMPLDETVRDALDATISSVPCEGDCFIVTAYGVTVRFEAGSGEIVADGRSYNIGAAPYKVGDVYYVPAGAFFRAIDFETEWNPEDGLLRAGITLELPPAQERFSAIEGVAAPGEAAAPGQRREVDKSIAPPAIAGEPGFEVVDPYLAYTFENSIKILSKKVGGDKTLSRVEEKGDIYNQLNFRFVGLMANGYDFTGILRTNQTTETGTKRGEVKKLSLTWQKNDILMEAYDVQPRFSNYLLRNYPVQGLHYQRQNNLFKWNFVYGKTPKRIRDSKYARYVGGLRIEKNVSRRKEAYIGGAITDVRDTGSYMGDAKQKNFAGSIDGSIKLSDMAEFEGEIANSYSRFSGFDSNRGTAAKYVFNYRSRSVLSKTTYERTSSNFVSETAYYTRGRTEFATLFNKKFSPVTMFGIGLKHKKIRDRVSKIYPMSLDMQPLGDRDYFRLSLQRNFEKTSGSRNRILDTREIRVRDKMGTSRIDVEVGRQKNKVPGSQLAYRDTKSLNVRSVLTDRIGAKFNIKSEKWEKDRVSVTRRLGLTLDYEPEPWTELTLGFGRYYNNPRSARTHVRFTYHRLDIYNDAEWKAEYMFENYRDYNINTVNVSYSFFK